MSDENFKKNFQNHVNEIADYLEEIKENNFFEDENEEQSYFDDTYNVDFIWRLGYGLMGVRIMVACGGPNIWVDTYNREVHGYWGYDEVTAPLSIDCCDLIDALYEDGVQDMIYNDRN